jgi:hypothetical protein
MSYPRHIIKPTSEQISNLFDRRAIAPTLWRERPYTLYDAGDWEKVLVAEPRFGTLLKPGQQSFLRKLVNQRAGLVMHRETIAGRDLLAQIRPFKLKEIGFDGADQGVWTAGYSHNHSNFVIHAHVGSKIVTLIDRRVQGRTLSDIEFDESFDIKPPRWGKPHETGAVDAAEHLESHRGRPVQDREPHRHRPSFRSHIEREHEGKEVTGSHSHDNYAKYLYPPGQAASLIDIHPRAWPLLDAGGDVAYLALEGLLKNDSILSDRGGTPVANFGSVTLWQDPMLERFARLKLARFRIVAVVPDSDWSGNSLVISQARVLAKELKRFGVNAVVAAPPAKCGPRCDHLTRNTGRKDSFGETIMLPDEDHKQGVDDHRGRGGELSEMVVDLRTNHRPPDVLRRRADQYKRDTAVLAYLRDICAPDGRAIVTHRQISEVVGGAHQAMGHALKSLEDQGLLTREDPQPFLDDRPGWKKPPTAVRLIPELVPRRELIRWGEYQQAAR